MFVDSQSTLYIVLTIAIALLTIFLCVSLIYLILILRDSSKMLEKIRETVDRVNTVIIKPVNLVSSVVDRVRPLIEAAIKRHGENRRKKGRGK